MSLQIANREREGIAIFDLTGRLVVGPSTNQFRETMEKSIKSGQANIVLNLKGVEYIDSTGLGALVLCFTQCQKAGGGLKQEGCGLSASPEVEFDLSAQAQRRRVFEFVQRPFDRDREERRGGFRRSRELLRLRSPERALSPLR